MNEKSEQLILSRIKDCIKNDHKLQQREAAQLVGVSHSKLNEIIKRHYNSTYTDFRILVINMKTELIQA
ncbi:MAG: hypothetical protein KDD94_11995 [Calditrichaeota bacterium]|nr:hypothetical protein [Calditrichota bacterium]